MASEASSPPPPPRGSIAAQRSPDQCRRKRSTHRRRRRDGGTGGSGYTGRRRVGRGGRGGGRRNIAGKGDSKCTARTCSPRTPKPPGRIPKADDVDPPASTENEVADAGGEEIASLPSPPPSRREGRFGVCCSRLHLCLPVGEDNGLLETDPLQTRFTKSESTDGFEAVISLCSDRTKGRESKICKSQISVLEDLPSKSGELHLAKIDKGRLHEAKTSAENEISCAKPELFRARSTARELARQIEEANAKAMAQRSQFQSMRSSRTRKKEYTEVMLELDNVKKELSKLQYDITSALEAKARAEEEIEAYTSKAQYHLILVDELKKEIDVAYEEHILVELARIEAEKEVQEVEAQREAEADRLAKSMDTAKYKIEEVHREIDQAKELKTQVKITNSDLIVLQNEMELVRAVQSSSRMKEEMSQLQSAQAELKAAKQVLASIKEEGFQLMASMDHIREEKMHVTEEANRLKRLEKKADSNVQHLNSELLNAKSRLESASVADERAKVIISNLLAALQQLQAETDATNREKVLVDEETRCTREETKKIDIEINSFDERLQAAAQQLKAIKTSEATALKKLKNVADRTMKARADSIYRRFALTISKCEYDYLFRSAKAVQVVADKKVAAAQLWIEALKAAESEITMRTEFAESENKDFRAMEEQKLCEMEKSLIEKKAMEEEICKYKGETSALQLAVVPPMIYSRKNGIPTTSERTDMRNASASSGNRNTRFRSFTIKRRNVVPDLVKLIRDKRDQARRIELLHSTARSSR